MIDLQTSSARGFRVVVLLKQVPGPGAEDAFGSDHRLVRRPEESELNPWCRRAVAKAVELAQNVKGHTLAVSMGPPSAADALREACAWGVNEALLVTGSELAGSDALATATVLARAIKLQGGADLVVAGHRSIDGSTGMVPAMVAELLDLPFAGPVLRCNLTGGGTGLEMTVQADNGDAAATVSLPAVITVAERSCAPAKVDRSVWSALPMPRTVPIDELGQGTWGVDSETWVSSVTPTSSDRWPIILNGDTAAQVDEALGLLVSRHGCHLTEAGSEVAVTAKAAGTVPDSVQHPGALVMVVAADAFCDGTRALLGVAAGIAVTCRARVLLVTPQACADVVGSWGADESLQLTGDGPGGVASALGAYLEANPTTHLLSGSGSWETEVLARLAARLGFGVMTDLCTLGDDDDSSMVIGELVGSKPSGRDTFATVRSRSALQAATVRTGLLPLRTPRRAHGVARSGLPVSPDPRVTATIHRESGGDDLLQRVSVVVGVGRGVSPENYPEIYALCEALGAELAATRPVTDEAHLPHGRQVGLTAQTISPALYIAVGISGSAHHLTGVGQAGVIVAINSDPQARIFLHCDIGIVAPWRAAVETLLNRLTKPDPHLSPTEVARAG